MTGRVGHDDAFLNQEDVKFELFGHYARAHTKPYGADRLALRPPYPKLEDLKAALGEPHECWGSQRSEVYCVWHAIDLPNWRTFGAVFASDGEQGLTRMVLLDDVLKVAVSREPLAMAKGPLNCEYIKALRLPLCEGWPEGSSSAVWVNYFVGSSPIGSNSSIRLGDVIVTINGQVVNTLWDVATIAYASPLGKSTHYGIRRNTASPGSPARWESGEVNDPSFTTSLKSRSEIIHQK
jgi:hypothetical protein